MTPGDSELCAVADNLMTYWYHVGAGMASREVVSNYITQPPGNYTMQNSATSNTSSVFSWTDFPCTRKYHYICELEGKHHLILLGWPS
jgi:hypothetical protein